MITVESFEFNFFQENTFVLYDDTKEAVIIDCGCLHKAEEETLRNFIESNQLQVKHLLCTHLHFDHIVGNKFVKDTYGVGPQANKLDLEIPSINEQAKLFGLPTKFDEVHIEKFLVGNETIRFGNSELHVITVPGHSPGSVAFYSAKDGFVISGDALFAGSIGRTDLWNGNKEVLVAAIRSKLLTLPDDTIIYPGHGPATNVINEKYNNPFL
jgi:glyoxylase-like metal-dependent hydrolase (beta-lactamase superfamily II)